MGKRNLIFSPTLLPIAFVNTTKIILLVKVQVATFFRLFLFFLSLWQFSSNVAYGQILFGLPAKQNALSFSSGIYETKPAFTVSAARSFHIRIGKKFINDDATTFIDFSTVSNFRTNTDFRFIFGGQVYFRKRHKFKILFRRTFTLDRYISPDLKTTFIGAELELMPGWYTEKGFVAADLYYGDSFTGHVSSSGSIGGILEDIGSGWIKPRVANIKAGVNGGYYYKEHYCFYGHFDISILKPLHKIPSLFYGYIGINYLF